MEPSVISSLRAISRWKLGIRAEDPKRIWERRAPLTPNAVYELIKSTNATVEVVSSSKRIFIDAEYDKAGASVVPALTNPDIVIGIKEPPLSELHRLLKNSTQSGDQTHIMFSHTTKGQTYNMPLLATFVAHNSTTPSDMKLKYPRLVDYELLTNEDGKRTVGFGWFAGVAGVMESFSSMAQSHLEMGVASPFLYTPRPHTVPSLAKLREALRTIGVTIHENGTPPELGPFIIGITGNGQVAQGCLSMVKELPIEEVSVNNLESLMTAWKNEGTSGVNLHKIYLVHPQPKDYLVRLDGGVYDRQHYYQYPQSYLSIFADKIAPYLTLFLNGTGWSPSFPRLMTNDQLRIALSRAKNYGLARFANIGDISCDVQGGLEFLSKATTLSSPFYHERPTSLPFELPSVQIMSVDILPASIPLDASMHFSSALLPYLKELINYYNAPLRIAFPSNLEKATVAEYGVLKGKHRWLQQSVDNYYKALPVGATESKAVIEGHKGKTSASATKVGPTRARSNSQKKNILMLGSGMVAAPTVDLIAQNPNINLVVASNSLLELHNLAAPHPNVNYVVIAADKLSTFSELISEADVVISLLPVGLHDRIAKECIATSTHLITASYASNDMQSLDEAARRAGVVLLNEIGLDPGIDHCTAVDLINRLKEKNKHVVSFSSFCGGLPAPEDSQVPLRYKFSWRPQGVLSAALKSARYMVNREIVTKPSLAACFPLLPIIRGIELEGMANRDSLMYIDRYGARSPSLRTFVRGTLRYPGFSTLMNSFVKLGMLNDSSKIQLGSWDEFVRLCLLARTKVESSSDSGLVPPLSSLIDTYNLPALEDALEWFGLSKPLREDTMEMPPIPQGGQTPIDIFAYLLSHKLRYMPHERDMVVLSHEIVTSTGATPEGVMEQHTSTLKMLATTESNVGFAGERPASAMARSVGIPVALAAMLVAEEAGVGGVGFLHGGGVVDPTHPEIYRRILDGLKRVGIEMSEESRVLSGATIGDDFATREGNAGRVEHVIAHDNPGGRTGI